MLWRRLSTYPPPLRSNCLQVTESECELILPTSNSQLNASIYFNTTVTKVSMTVSKMDAMIIIRFQCCNNNSAYRQPNYLHVIFICTILNREILQSLVVDTFVGGNSFIFSTDWEHLKSHDDPTLWAQSDLADNNFRGCIHVSFLSVNIFF